MSQPVGTGRLEIVPSPAHSPTGVSRCGHRASIAQRGRGQGGAEEDTLGERVEGGGWEGVWLEPSRELEGGSEFGGLWKERSGGRTGQVLVPTNMG